VDDLSSQLGSRPHYRGPVKPEFDHVPGSCNDNGSKSGGGSSSQGVTLSADTPAGINEPMVMDGKTAMDLLDNSFFESIGA
jgi:hypothetical protein